MNISKIIKVKMNRFLGYNIASEPTLSSHEKHRFPLVDGATYFSWRKYGLR